MVHPADLCFKLPDSVSLEEGAICEPLSVGVHACRRAKVGPETKIIIIGAEPIGLVTMLAARAFGSPKIVIVDIDDQCLSFAKDLGADEIIKVSSNVQVLIFLFQYIVVVFPLMAKYGCFMQCSRCRMWKMKWDKYAMQWEVLWI